jgi:hypothetical protein
MVLDSLQSNGLRTSVWHDLHIGDDAFASAVGADRCNCRHLHLTRCT